MLELADVSPLIDIPLAGRTALRLNMLGPMKDPVLTGSIGIDDLWFAGFPLGNLRSETLRFVPLVVQLESGTLTKGASEVLLKNASIDFDTGATVAAQASLQSRRFDLRDLFAMWHFDEDPRFDDVKGKGDRHAGALRFGGPEEKMRRRQLADQGAARERWHDLGRVRRALRRRRAASFDFNWFDIDDATTSGHVELDVPRLTLRKGTGTMLGSFGVRRAPASARDLIATHLPVSEIQGLGPLARRAVGTISAEASVSGTLDALAAQIQARISPLHIGRSELPASAVSVRLVPIVRPVRALGKSACGAPISGGFDRAESGQSSRRRVSRHRRPVRRADRARRFPDHPAEPEARARPGGLSGARPLGALEPLAGAGDARPAAERHTRRHTGRARPGAGDPAPGHGYSGAESPLGHLRQHTARGAPSQQSCASARGSWRCRRSPSGSGRRADRARCSICAASSRAWGISPAPICASHCRRPRSRASWG